jgi:hypothetical protein
VRIAVRQQPIDAPYLRWPARRRAVVVRPARGFTLLEVILAVGLSAVLILSIASAVDLYRRMTTYATDDMSETRLVRAVFARFEKDINSVIPPQPIAAAATSTSTSSSTGTPGSSSSSSSSSSTGSAQGTDPLQYVYSRSVFGLYGDGSSLVLNTLTPHPLPLEAQQQTGAQSATQASSSTANLPGVHGDMKVVAYCVIGGPQSAILPFGAAGQSTPEGKAITSGLARLEGERMAIGYSIENGSSSSLSARILAPEVQSVEFRYFDGSSWAGTWSGATTQALPTAVEITIAIGGNDPYGARTQAGQEQAARTYRHVVAITTAASPQPIAQQTINSTTANMSQ